MNMFLKNSSNKVHTLIMEQIKDVEGCLLNFENFMRAATTEETAPETLRSLYIGVHQMENEADKSLRAMIDSLNGSFLPSTREDLISIATSCDKVANKCEHTAMMMVIEKFGYPEEFAEDIMEMISITHEQFELLEKAISMVFAQMGELQKDHSILDEIRGLESKVDALEEKLYEATFEMPIGLAERMQLSKYVELVADISDIIENIADKIQIMLITRKA